MANLDHEKIEDVMECEDETCQSHSTKKQKKKKEKKPVVDSDEEEEMQEKEPSPEELKQIFQQLKHMNPEVAMGMAEDSCKKSKKKQLQIQEQSNNDDSESDSDSDGNSDSSDDDCEAEEAAVGELVEALSETLESCLRDDAGNSVANILSAQLGEMQTLNKHLAKMIKLSVKK